jgi:DNA polymerase III gamma/tau subunit
VAESRQRPETGEITLHPITITLGNQRTPTDDQVEIRNWRKFKENIRLSTTEIKNENDLNTAVEALEVKINASLKDNNKNQHKENNKQTTRPHPNHPIATQTKESNQKKVQPNTVTPRQNHSKFTKKAKQELEKQKNDQWDKKLEQINEKKENPWNLAKSLRKEKTTIQRTALTAVRHYSAAVGIHSRIVNRIFESFEL